MRSLLAVLRIATAATRRPLGRFHVRFGLTSAVVLGAGLTGLFSPATAAAACDLTASPSSFGSEVAAAATGQTVCLTTGDYGSWRGTNKAITVTAAPGNTPTMQVDFASGAAGFTLDSMSGVNGTISSGASNVTIQNSTFNQQLVIQGSVTNIVINHNNLTYPVQSQPSGANSKIFLDTDGGAAGSAVTIENNDIQNGDLDGVNIGAGNGAAIVGNVFANLCDRNVNHTDNIQFDGGSTGTLIARNYVYEAQNCPTQGITAYDGGIHGLLIEDNVVDIPRDWGIELYSDQGSTVLHNTLVWHPKTYSEFHTGGGTGQIGIDRKSQDPAGSGTQIYDNIVTSVDIADGSTGNAYDNVSGQRALYVGPSTSWAGYALASNSPVGLHAGSDGLDDGIRVPASQTSSPPPPTQTTSSAKPKASALRVTAFRFAPAKFGLARAATRRGSHVRRGTSIRFHLSAAAKVTISFARVLAGRRFKGRCVGPTRKLARHRACTRYHGVGSITVRRAAGNRSVGFTGRLGGRWLARGRYRATIVARTAAGRRSAARTAIFTIA